MSATSAWPSGSMSIRRSLLRGHFVGTPSYMAPEQAGTAGSGHREPLAPAADVYSLGAILYHMLTGRPPFQAATPVETMLLALEHDPIAPRVLNPRVNPDLEMIALKCLQKPPALRYPVSRGPGRRSGIISPWRSGVGPLDQPAGAGRPADGRDPPRAGSRKLGLALDLPQHRSPRLLRRDQLAVPLGHESTLALCFRSSQSGSAAGRRSSGPCAAGADRSGLSSGSSPTSGEPESSRST